MLPKLRETDADPSSRPKGMETSGTGLVERERHHYEDEGNVMEDPDINRETLCASSSSQGHPRHSFVYTLSCTLGRKEAGMEESLGILPKRDWHPAKETA